jgi:hypothetical protein
VACAELGGDKDFTVDVATPVKLHEVSISVVDQGGAHTSLPFVLDPANDCQVEVRVIINQAAFAGRLALDAVTLRPQQGSEELLELLTTASHA